MRLTVFICTLLLFFASCLQAQQNDTTSVPAMEQPIALMNGIAHISQTSTIEDALITLKGHEITLVADARLVRVQLEGYQIIPVSQQHIYAIMVDSLPANSNIQLKATTIQSKQNNITFRIQYISSEETHALLATGQPANLVVLNKPIEETGKIRICHIIIDGKLQDPKVFRLKKYSK